MTEEDIVRFNQPFTKEEIVIAIKSLGKNKAVGTDGISAELYQHFADKMADIYSHILDACYEVKTTTTNHERSIDLPSLQERRHSTP